MKINSLLWVLMPFCLICAISCNTVRVNRSNGWYAITNGVQDSISHSPIVTVKDFDSIGLDSSLNGNTKKMIYQIYGKLKAIKIMTFADATEKAMGKSIAFVYNNAILSNPYVNMRIESGVFAISFPLNFKRESVLEIYNSIKREMKQ